MYIKDQFIEQNENLIRKFNPMQALCELNQDYDQNMSYKYTAICLKLLSVQNLDIPAGDVCDVQINLSLYNWSFQPTPEHLLSRMHLFLNKKWGVSYNIRSEIYNHPGVYVIYREGFVPNLPQYTPFTVKVVNNSTSVYTISPGDKIAQIQFYSQNNELM